MRVKGTDIPEEIIIYDWIRKDRERRNERPRKRIHPPSPFYGPEEDSEEDSEDSNRGEVVIKM